MTYTCGLDFGTSNSAIVITNKATRQQLFVENDSSILYFADSNDYVYSVGREAVQDYVGSNMSGRLLKSVKTLLKQTDFKHTHIFGKKVTPEQLCSLIIANLKKKAESALGEQIDSVVLGRPVVFSEDAETDKIAEKRLLDAALMAGFKDIKLLYEPIAAAYTYEATLTKAEKVLVADFGGGTSDFTIVNLSPRQIKSIDRKSDIIATGGVYIGGDLFDSQIMWHKLTPLLGRGSSYKSGQKELEMPNKIYWELKRWERTFLLQNSKLRRDLNHYFVFSDRNKMIEDLMTLIDNNLVYSLFQVIEQSKITLSGSPEAPLLFNALTIAINEKLNYTDFSIYIKDEVDKIRQCVEDLLVKSNLKAGQIDTVFLTGGSSAVIPVRQVFLDMFGEGKIRTGDNFNSIACGLSLSE